MPIDRYIAPSRSQWPELTCRATADDTDIEASVREILDTVRRDGDTAVIEYENRFDRASFAQAADLKVTEEEKIQAEDPRRQMPSEGRSAEACRPVYSRRKGTSLLHRADACGPCQSCRLP